MTGVDYAATIRAAYAPRFGLEGAPLRQAAAQLLGGPADGVAIALASHVLKYGDRLPVRGEYDDGTGQEKTWYLRRDRVLHPAAARLTEYVFDGLPT